MLPRIDLSKLRIEGVTVDLSESAQMSLITELLNAKDELERTRRELEDMTEDRNHWRQQWTELNRCYMSLNQAARHAAAYLSDVEGDDMAQELYKLLRRALRQEPSFKPFRTISGSGPLEFYENDNQPNLKSDAFKRPWDEPPSAATWAEKAAALFDKNAEPPVYPRWGDVAGLGDQPSLNARTGEAGNNPHGWKSASAGATQAKPTVAGKLATAEALQSAGVLDGVELDMPTLRKQWDGFVLPAKDASLMVQPGGNMLVTDITPGYPECPTCERRVQQGEQLPFPHVQASQWVNHSGRVWTRLCEACKSLDDAGKLPRGDRGFP